MDQPLLLQAGELEKVAALSRFEALEGFVEEEFQLQTYLGPQGGPLPVINGVITP